MTGWSIGIKLADDRSMSLMLDTRDMRLGDAMRWRSLSMPSRFLYGPRFTPFLRSLRWLSRQVSAMPYLIQRSHGRPTSQRLQALWQAEQAFLTCLRLGRTVPTRCGLAATGES